ncbi:MAG: VTT domain-containing protein, partial [Planctomycetales bacterium]|nr:VTT domain-containing protein [Planctomycetales bacterium]
RSWVAGRIARYPVLAAADSALGRRALLMVALLRLSPVVPFNLLNYGLALTRVRFGPYLLASAVAMLPGTFLYVYVGSLAGGAAELASGGAALPGPARAILLGAGLVATLAAVAWITRLARRELAAAVHGPATTEATR